MNKKRVTQKVRVTRPVHITDYYIATLSGRFKCAAIAPNADSPLVAQRPFNSANRRTWHVAHRTTGYLVAHDFTSQRDAMAAIAYMVKAIDWTKVTVKTRSSDPTYAPYVAVVRRAERRYASGKRRGRSPQARA
jgi:hypothetical protein